MTSVNIHGTGLVLDGAGVLLRGPSGSGKSLLALLLIESFARAGKSAFLVSDDRVDLAREDGIVMMRAPARMAGLIELRGRGIVSRPYQAETQLHLVVDLVDDFVRMLEDDALQDDVLGLTVDRAPVPRAGRADPAHQRLLVEEAIAALQGRN